MIANQSITLACIAVLAQAVMLNPAESQIEDGIERKQIDAAGASAIVHASKSFDDLSGTENGTQNQLQYGKGRYQGRSSGRSSPDTCYDQYSNYPAAYSYSETKCRPQNDYGYSDGYHGSGQDYYAGFSGQQQPSFYDQSYRHETYPDAGGYGHGYDSYPHSHGYESYSHGHGCDSYPHSHGYESYSHGHGCGSYPHSHGYESYPHSHGYGDIPHSHGHGDISHSHGGCNGKAAGCKGKCHSGGNGSFDPFFTLPYYGTLNNSGDMTTSWNQCLTYKPNYYSGSSSGHGYDYSPYSHSGSYTPHHHHGSSGGYDTYRSPNTYHCDSYDRYHEPSQGRGCNDYSYGRSSGYSNGGYSNGGYRGCDGGRQQCTDYECICRPKGQYQRNGRSPRVYATEGDDEVQGVQQRGEESYDDQDGYGNYDDVDPRDDRNRVYQDEPVVNNYNDYPCTPDFCTPGAPRQSSKLQTPDDEEEYRVYEEPKYYDPVSYSEPKETEPVVQAEQKEDDSGIFNWNGWGR